MMAFKKITSVSRDMGITKYIKFRWTTTGQGRAYISAAVPLGDATHIYMEFDEDKKIIRLRPAKDGEGCIKLTGASYRACAIPKAAMREIDNTERLILDLRDDGFYYGNYAKNNGEATQGA